MAVEIDMTALDGLWGFEAVFDDCICEFKLYLSAGLAAGVLKRSQVH